MSHVTRMSHLTHMIKSRHTCKWVMSPVCTSHVTHRPQSCHTSAIYMNETCHKYERDMSNVWKSRATHVTHTHLTHTHLTHTHVTHIKALWHTCQCVMPHIWRHACGMTRSHGRHFHVWHDLIVCVTYLMCVTWLISVWLIHLCDLFWSHTHTPTHVNKSYHTCHPPVDWVIHQKWAASRFGIQFKTSKRYRLAKTSQSSAQQSFQTANWVTNWPFKQIFTKALYLDIR